jgi:PKHD-type hydroxylase
MQHILTPYSSGTPPFVRWEGGFNEQELDWLQHKAKNAQKRANVGKGDADPETLNKIRRSDVDWLYKNNETEWLFNRLGHIVSSLNTQFYRFDLTGFGEPLQLTNYDHSDKGMYGWHQDYGSRVSTSRKLSLVLQLTDPSEYEGGNLQIMTGGEPTNVHKQRGFVAVFPSYVVHQVTPVTQGSRQSLVAWITGPEFR